MSGKVLIAAVLLTLTLAGASAAPAGNASSTIVYTDEVDFDFPAGTCPDLPSDLSLHFTGTVHGHFHLSLDAQGVAHVNGTETITGTVEDSEGATYRFNYHNAVHAQDAGLPVLVTVTDHFSLVGNGAANQLHVFFVQRLLFTATSVEVVFENSHGDPACDAL